MKMSAIVWLKNQLKNAKEEDEKEKVKMRGYVEVSGER